MTKRTITNLTRNKKKKKILHKDSFENVITGLGSRLDKQSASQYGMSRTIERDELEEFYRNNWIAKAIDGKVFDMIRKWRTFKSSSIDPDKIKELEAVEKNLQLKNKFKQALTWASIYGGAAIIMNVNNQGDLSEELNYKNVQQGDLDRITVVDRWMLTQSGVIEYNPLSKNFGEPDYYQLAWDTANTQIHPSRVIRINGREMPIHIKKTLHFWGDSDIQRIYDALIKNDTVYAAISTMVHDTNVDAMKIAGISEALMQEDGAERIIETLMTLNQSKSLLNMIAIDSDDEYIRNPISFAALPDIQKNFQQIVAGAVDYPYRRLIGEQVGGLGAVGDGSTLDYYDSIKNLQESKLVPKLDVLDQVMVRSALGEYPDDLCYEFNPLWQVSDSEQADIDIKKADKLLKLSDLGVPESILMRDAVEAGILNNMEESDIDEYERNVDNEIEEDDEFNE